MHPTGTAGPVTGKISKQSRDQAVAVSKTEFQSLNHGDSCTPPGECRSQNQDEMHEGWEQSILTGGGLGPGNVSRGNLSGHSFSTFLSEKTFPSVVTLHLPLKPKIKRRTFIKPQKRNIIIIIMMMQ